MVTLDRIDDHRIFLILSAEIRTDLNMGPFDLMIDGFADVVQKSGPFGKPHIAPALTGHKARQLSDFHGMTKRVLTVRGTEPHPSQQLDQLRMEIVYADLKGRLLAVLPNLRLDFLPGLLHHFLNAGRMDPAVYDELLQRDPGHLPADRIKSGQNHGLRRIVDDQVHAGQRLDGPDVPAFPADNPSLHLIARQLDDGNR